MPFVPDGFTAPTGLETTEFRLEPLQSRHNEADFTAWTGSLDHVRATPGFPHDDWPSSALSLRDNLADLVQHERDFEDRRGFTFTVLEAASDQIIGCVYLYPPRRDGYDVDLRCWTVSDYAHLDEPLLRAVLDWVDSSWPFAAPDYAERPTGR